jgi:hypothetical protein
MPHLSRRAVVRLGGRGLLALGSLLPFLGCSARTAAPEAAFDWERFIAQLTRLAEGQHDPAWDQPGHLAGVRDLLMRLDQDDARIQRARSPRHDPRRRFPAISDLHRTLEVQVCLLEFAAGERIPLHDHPDMTGCIRCLGGRIEVRNFTAMTRAEPGGEVLLRQESAVTMRAGSCGTLTSTVGNLHDLVAQEDTRLIDVFTPPYDGQRTERSRWYALDPLAREDGLYWATVRG